MVQRGGQIECGSQIVLHCRIHIFYGVMTLPDLRKVFPDGLLEMLQHLFRRSGQDLSGSLLRVLQLFLQTGVVCYQRGGAGQVGSPFFLCPFLQGLNGVVASGAEMDQIFVILRSPGQAAQTARISRRCGVGCRSAAGRSGLRAAVGRRTETGKAIGQFPVSGQDVFCQDGPVLFVTGFFLIFGKPLQAADLFLKGMEKIMILRGSRKITALGDDSPGS